jgi:hypothetical protein
LLVALYSCQQEKVQDLQTPYFDNPSFFEAEIARLNKSKMGAIKQLKAGESEGKARVEIVDWKKELEIFCQLDLNKAVYSGKLKPTITESGTETITSLDRIGEHINIINFTISNDTEGKVKWLKASKRDISLFTETNTIWRYVPDSGFSIKGEEKIKGLITNTFEVNSVFEQF